MGFCTKVEVETQIGAVAVYIRTYPADTPVLDVVAIFVVPFPKRIEFEYKLVQPVPP